MSLVEEYGLSKNISKFVKKKIYRDIREGMKEVDDYSKIHNPYDLINSALSEHYYIEAFAVADQYIKHLLWYAFLDLTTGLDKTSKNAWQDFVKKLNKSYSDEKLKSKLVSFRDLRVEVIHFALFPNKFLSLYERSYNGISIKDYLNNMVKEIEDVFLLEDIKYFENNFSSINASTIETIKSNRFEELNETEISVIGRILLINQPLRTQIYTYRYFEDFIKEKKSEEKLLDLWLMHVNEIFFDNLKQYESNISRNRRK